MEYIDVKSPRNVTNHLIVIESADETFQLSNKSRKKPDEKTRG